MRQVTVQDEQYKRLRGNKIRWWHIISGSEWSWGFSRLYAVDAYKRRYVKLLISITDMLELYNSRGLLGNKLCILSVVRVGHPLVICEVSSEALKWRSVESVRSRVGCQSTWLRKWLTGHVFFTTPMKRDTTLATEVQRTSSFIPIKTEQSNIALQS